jgi:hypothetical protein
MSAPSPTDRADHLPFTDGALLEVRSIRPADRDALAALFARLSARSLPRRLLAPKPSVTAAELRYLVDVDHSSHEASVAIDASSGSIVAESRYAAWPGREGVADLAVTVADDRQGDGNRPLHGAIDFELALDRRRTLPASSPCAA